MPTKLQMKGRRELVSPFTLDQVQDMVIAAKKYKSFPFVHMEIFEPETKHSEFMLINFDNVKFIKNTEL